MLTFRWDALRRRDTVFVHDAVHLTAVDDHDCWRCIDDRLSRPGISVAAGPELSGVR